MKTDIGKLILRLMVGGLMLFHGLAKITHGIEFIKGTLLSKGLPELMSYGVYVGEVDRPVNAYCRHQKPPGRSNCGI